MQNVKRTLVNSVFASNVQQVNVALVLPDLPISCTADNMKFSAAVCADNPLHSAADDLKALLVHGATYLMNCHDPVTNSLVSHVSSSDAPGPDTEWVNPGARSNANVRPFLGFTLIRFLQVFCFSSELRRSYLVVC